VQAHNANSKDNADDVNVDSGYDADDDDFSTFQARTHMGVLSPGFSTVLNLKW
jgi:hypothetical protein